MSDAAVLAPDLSTEPLAAPPAAGDRIGHVRLTACSEARVEFRIPGELGWGRGLVGMVPILWAAGAWLMCWREGLLAQRMNGCIGLTAMAIVSAALMASSLGTAWKFDGRRKRITRRVGLLGRNTNARKWAGLRVDSTKVSTFADVQLKMVLVDATGHPGLEITTWSRREIDRAQVDALATAIRQTMGWA